VRFDTLQEIKAQAAKIESVTVVTRTMPPGNATKMTRDERELLGRWFSAGASIE
jgi:YD repeat-containing protein